jgi:hypothetical protein
MCPTYGRQGGQGLAIAVANSVNSHGQFSNQKVLIQLLHRTKLNMDILNVCCNIKVQGKAYS